MNDSPPPQIVQLHGLLEGLRERAFNRRPKYVAELVELDLCVRLTERLIEQYPQLTMGADGKPCEAPPEAITGTMAEIIAMNDPEHA